MRSLISKLLKRLERLMRKDSCQFLFPESRKKKSKNLLNSFLSKLPLVSKKPQETETIELYEIKMITESTEVFECT